MKIHFNTLREMLKMPEPVNVTVVTRSGEVQQWNNVVSLKYKRYSGTRRMKFLESGQIRQVRDVCIVAVNNMEVYL